MEYLIEVSYKPGFFDALGNTAKKDIKDLGIPGVSKVKSAQLYHIEGEIKEKELKFLCEELLSDPITQQYKISISSDGRWKTRLAARQAKDEHIFTVQVWYKKGVTDAVADTVKKGTIDLGIQGMNTVKTGYEYTIIGNVSSEQIERICRGLLANKVVQEYL